MPEPAVRVEGLWKQYRLGGGARAGETFYDLLSRGLRGRLSRRTARTGREEALFWALRDLSFEVGSGEVLGVIGRNGAGKSTLLKVLTRITEPTRGRVEIRGRVASLLEVGTGFHPELTGRENIYLNGAILGMSRQEIARKFDEIVAFAEVEKFLDTPVKRYSSGMYVRLAFAVAAHLEPDVLLVDEVLAVGDAEFQRRCLGKMEQVATAGRTVVFVSHNITAVRRLCSQGLLLGAGTALSAGPIADVLRNYAGYESGSVPEVELRTASDDSMHSVVRRVAARPGTGRPGDPLLGTLPLSLEVDIAVAEVAQLDVFIHCYDSQQTMVFSSGSFFDAACDSGPLTPGIHRFTCTLPGHLLNDDTYVVDVLLLRNRHEIIANESSVLAFRVEDNFAPIPDWQWRPAGVVRPRVRWSRLRHPASLEGRGGATGDAQC